MKKIFLVSILVLGMLFTVGQVFAQGGPPYDGTGATEGDSPIDVGNVTQVTIHHLNEGEEFVDITLFWNANTEPDLAGYKIYYKFGVDGKIYFVATAYDNEVPSLESGYSNEVNSWQRYEGIPPTAPVITSGSYTLSNGTVVIINGDGSLTITLPGGEVVNINP